MTAELKDQVRKRLFTQRKQLGEAERQRQSGVICQVLLDWYRGLDANDRPARKVAMTIKFGTEPNTDPVMQSLHADGVEIWVPVSHADRSMSWVRWTPDVPMESSKFGPIKEPVGQRFGPEAVADADAIVVPALAVDSDGYRLGKGGGYYDRFLATLPQLTQRLPFLVTPVFDYEFVDAAAKAFPVDEHDLPVQAVITAETGLVWI
jgi:5-formyltetrahydrofolate cyclo-ligase